MTKKTIWLHTLDKHENTDITIRGWLFNKRASGGILFLMIRDGTGIIQATINKETVEESLFQELDHLPMESALSVSGMAKKEPKSISGWEIIVKDAEIISISQEFPLGNKEHGPAFLLDNRHLWIRQPTQRAILSIRATLIRQLRNFFDERGFTLVDTPIFTPAACEGTTTLFETEYFGEKAYLSQSGQLYNEANIAAFGKVYCFGPTFRAEKSKTRRHLTEFWMIEPEVAFISLDENMALQEEMLSTVIDKILSKHEKQLKFLKRDLTILKNTAKGNFPRISYDEAIERINKAGINVQWGGDLGAEDETVLANQFDRPFFVHRFPTAVKAFYMEPDPERPEVVLGSDCLAPEGYGEIIGGGQRIWDLELLMKRVKEHNLPESAFEWFFDLRRYGTVPHGGFGLGIERTITWITGIKHLRETIPYPRMMNRLKP